MNNKLSEMRLEIPTHSEIKEIVTQSFKEVLTNDLPSILRKANTKRWVSPQELEKITGISIRKQQYLRTRRKIPFTKKGRSVRYDMDEIETWIQADKIEARK